MVYAKKIVYAKNYDIHPDLKNTFFCPVISENVFSIKTFILNWRYDSSLPIKHPYPCKKAVNNVMTN
jgi:hypothetical protein